MSARGTGQPRFPRPPRPHGGTGAEERRAFPRLVLAAVCGAYAVGAVLGWGSQAVALFMGDFGLSAAAFTAAGSCVHYARAHPDTPLRPAWTLFGVSSAMAGLGNGIWGWYEVVLDVPVPSPSAADFCFLLFAPPAIIGLLVLAKRPVTRAGWTRLLLDAWLVGGSLLTLSWSLALDHTSHWQGESLPLVALSLAYPLMDIVLISMVLALHFRRSSAHRSAVNTVIGALALTVLCDALFTSPLLRENYSSGQILDAGWFAGSLLLAYAPWVGYREGDGRPVVRPPVPGNGAVAGSLAALAPYLAATVCTLGILYNVRGGGAIDPVVLLTGCTVVLALVIRQGIMLLENIRLTQELAQKENHFRSLVQGSSDVIMIASPAGILRYVSPAAAGVYGREPDRLVGSELASLIHPEDLGRVLHEVRRFLATPPREEPSTRIECRIRHASGRWLNIESTVNRYQGGLIFNSRDVTERVRLQAQLQHNASHDPLTDLPNRSLFTERVHQALGGRRRGDAGAGHTALLYIDLDGFKAVNDTIGHQAGDELLIQAARRLREAVRAGDTAARLGGDEFAALIVGDGKCDRAEREYRVLEIAERLRATLSRPYQVEGGEARVAASIGVAFAESGVTPAVLMRHADLAMYRAKQAGKNRVELYASQPQAEAVRRAELTTDRLRGVLAESEFALLHQPVVEFSSGKITSVTAQARRRPARGVLFPPGGPRPAPQGQQAVPPAQYGPQLPHGPAADARGGDAGRWLLRRAIEQAAERHHAGYRVPVSVRLDARRLTDRSTTPATVETLLSRHGLPPDALIVELADTDPRVSLDELELWVTALRRTGVGITLDGFGGAHCGLAALRRLPADALRLDRALVDGVVGSPRVRKITSGLLRIADDLGMLSVAGGVDLPEQADALRELGCTHAQGAAFSKPLDEHRLRRALARGSYPVSGGEQHFPGIGRAVVVAGSMPAHRSGPAAHGPAKHPPLRSNSETSVPPT
ncbi:diguanylate cyclase domain-containing protein [Streptomyces sp. CNQ085]|uniref:diguanylate cyclase domain-containing protein n=1 Tax=Streptomyces sp. CNQ085 TaxID=2886944 RepID=UPI001F50EA9D|nr:diguanylate cyclase [Streptomyces sp. CNQ085]MCI0385214.1 diguanylate cyclase [Streptomyces sp. CNQ085]